MTGREGRDKMRSLAYFVSALLAGSLMWLGIWVAAVSALYHSRKERQVPSEGLPRIA